MEVPTQVEREIAGIVAGFIREQNAKYSSRAGAIDERLRKLVAPFFRPDLLAATRVVVLNGDRVPNPSIYKALREMGLEQLPDFADMAAVTFNDVIVSHQPFTARLLFHELVHAEQYRQLGVERFAELYVRGFLNGGGYDGIPLEVNAYALDTSFSRAPKFAFSVEKIVTEWITEGKY